MIWYDKYFLKKREQVKAKKLDRVLENLSTISTSILRDDLKLDAATVNYFRSEYWKRIQQEYKYLLREEK